MHALTTPCKLVNPVLVSIILRPVLKKMGLGFSLQKGMARLEGLYRVTQFVKRRTWSALKKNINNNAITSRRRRSFRI
jgi:hypothetical protein